MSELASVERDLDCAFTMAEELRNRLHAGEMPDAEELGTLVQTVCVGAIKLPRDEAVRGIMSEPFPIVSRSLHLDHVSTYLEQGAGAVLVELGPDEGFQIITKSDLISALAGAGRPGNAFHATP